MSLIVDPHLARAYTAPGQYIEVETERGNGYFVLASDVGESPWQLLVKKTNPGASDALAMLPLGSAFSIAGVLGSGFSAERMAGRHVAVAVVASAFGLARTVLRRRIADGHARGTHLFLGLRALDDAPLQAEIEGWMTAGVTVVLCLSRPPSSDGRGLPSARRASGRVQQVLGRAIDEGEVPRGSVVIAAGPDELLADLTALADVPLENAGAPGPSIELLTNL